jgi:hypothetical protein
MSVNSVLSVGCVNKVYQVCPEAFENMYISLGTLFGLILLGMLASAYGESQDTTREKSTYSEPRVQDV